jgi:hypothetical protein
MLLLSFGLTGCIGRHRVNTLPALPDIRVPRACVNQDVLLKRCDLNFNPPQCQYSVVNWIAGCEIVVPR